ncbi:MAG: helix-turn-helix transcriptional regulator [Chloroflexota bacterium]
MKAGSKYYPLFQYLSASQADEITLSLAQVEALLGQSLPASAHHRRDWWGNRRQAPHAAAWLDAGYHIQHVDLEAGYLRFYKPLRAYTVQRDGDTVLWDRDLVKALRLHMGFNQTQFAAELGVRQQTVSEWETGSYTPSRATCKYLSLVAERAGFAYTTSGSETS